MKKQISKEDYAKECKEQAQGLLSMYQAGFMDGFLCAAKKTHPCFKLNAEKTMPLCKEAFEKRFNVKKVKGGVEK